MRVFRFLALTDHSKHSAENSMYAILSALSRHPQCACVDVASRGNINNKDFFYNLSGTRVECLQAGPDFKYQADGRQFTLNTHQADVTGYDVILMRLPRPVSHDFMQYISTVASDKIIINDPLGIEITGNKSFLLNFQELCPPMRLCRSVDDVLSFAAKFPIVLKPLKGHGGAGVVKIEGDKLHNGTEVHDLIEYLSEIEHDIKTEGYLAMQFLKNVAQGDKRILVAGGDILAVSLRLPAEGSWLCNVAQGGTSVATEIEHEEEAIIRTIWPVLEKHGILIFGVDTLVDDSGLRILSEINTLSIGGFPQAEAQSGRPIIQELVNKMIAYVNERYR